MHPESRHQSKTKFEIDSSINSFWRAFQNWEVKAPDLGLLNGRAGSQRLILTEFDLWEPTLRSL